VPKNIIKHATNATKNNKIFSFICLYLRLSFHFSFSFPLLRIDNYWVANFMLIVHIVVLRIFVKNLITSNDERIEELIHCHMVIPRHFSKKIRNVIISPFLIATSFLNNHQ